MAVTTGLYYSYLKNQENGNAIDLDATTIRCALFTYAGSATVANLNSTSYTTLTGECATSGNYTQGGRTVSMTAVSGTSIIKITCSPITFTSLTTTVRYAVLFSSVGSALIEYIDFGADQSPAGQNLVLTPAGTGLITKTV